MSRRADIVTAAIAVVRSRGLAVAIVRDQAQPRVRSRPIEVEFRRPAGGAEPAKPALAEPSRRGQGDAAPARPVAQKLAMVEPRPAAVEPPRRPQPTSRPPTPPVLRHRDGVADRRDVADRRRRSADRPSPTRASRPARTRGATGVGEPGDGNGRAAPPRCRSRRCRRSTPTPAADRSPTHRRPNRPASRGRCACASRSTRGHVSSARVLRGLGYGLDQAAVEALTHRCHFTPAIANDGRPVPFVIESYTFDFELPR